MTLFFFQCYFYYFLVFFTTFFTKIPIKSSKKRLSARNSRPFSTHTRAHFFLLFFFSKNLPFPAPQEDVLSAPLSPFLPPKHPSRDRAGVLTREARRAWRDSLPGQQTTRHADGETQGAAAPQRVTSGTERRDTDTGLRVVFHGPLLRDGEPEIITRGDGEELSRTRGQVTPVGAAVLRGVEGPRPIAAFPGPDERVPVEWQQRRQNCVRTASAPAEAEPEGSGDHAPSCGRSFCLSVFVAILIVFVGTRTA